MLVASSTFFGCMAFAAKLASVNISGSEVAMIRFLISLAPVLVIPSFRKAAFTFTRIDLLIYRGFFGGLAVLLYFLAIAHIPVGIATLLNYTAPIFSGLFAAMFIGEPLRPAVIAPLGIAMVGVALVVIGRVEPHRFLGFGVWELAGLGSAILSGAAVTAIRSARRTEGAWAIFASFSLFGLVATAPFALWSWKTPTPREWGLLLAVGLLSIAAQLLMTYSYRWVETVTAGVISQLAVVISMMLGFVFLHEVITTKAAIGSLLTLTGVLLIMLVSARRKASAFDEAPEQ